VSRRVLRVLCAEGDLAPEARILLTPEESHHAARVLRLRDGDAVRVFDGRGREFEALVVAADPRRTQVRLVSEMRDAVESGLTVRLYQGNCKPERMAWAVQNATEIGVASIHPLLTERVENRPGPRGGERLQRVALEAAKQSGRRRVPQVTAPGPLPDPRTGEVALLLDTSGASPRLGEEVCGEAPSEVWLAVGPEGGFTTAEVESAVSAGWRAVAMGPRILRSETAGVVAAALILHLWGDLGRG
jgi:16S rRNA (uracil1498-N3)-methyltransferase